ncbi:MAG: 5'-nucleotidase, lipoprotein e(P4) family, partial [Desulfobacterales bacterium]|nr:5'-nucleotidase, lipoprotein e(P4) family [Desulfobacterales bacterium]
AWYQNSAEMAALSHQAFNMARMIFDMDLAKGDAGKRRAVVVDIDETILDNSPFNAGMVDKDYGYPKGWKEWCAAEEARALPGSVAFLKYAAEKGAEVFYISNRKAKKGYDLTESTMNNLKKLGFPFVDKKHLLLRTGSSDKEARRQATMANNRVVLWLGDNLNDFASVFGSNDGNERAAAVDKMKGMFGKEFILLPNPIYGAFEGAIYKGNWKMSVDEKSAARKQGLRRFELPE